MVNRPHDLRLDTKICSVIRPEIIGGTPNHHIQLMTQYCHPDPSRRPTG